MELGPFEFRDKIPLKRHYEQAGRAGRARARRPAGARTSRPASIMMPSYVNIGAYVGEDTMVDTWATVGSCAQIGDERPPLRRRRHRRRARAAGRGADHGR